MVFLHSHALREAANMGEFRSLSRNPVWDYHWSEMPFCTVDRADWTKRAGGKVLLHMGRNSQRMGPGHVSSANGPMQNSEYGIVFHETTTTRHAKVKEKNQISVTWRKLLLRTIMEVPVFLNSCLYSGVWLRWEPLLHHIYMNITKISPRKGGFKV